jgi:hypothetical protein
LQHHAHPQHRAFMRLARNHSGVLARVAP